MTECPHSPEMFTGFPSVYKRNGMYLPLYECNGCGEGFIDFGNPLGANLEHIKNTFGEIEYQEAIKLLKNSKFASIIDEIKGL